MSSSAPNGSSSNSSSGSVTSALASDTRIRMPPDNSLGIAPREVRQPDQLERLDHAGLRHRRPESAQAPAATARWPARCARGAASRLETRTTIGPAAPGDRRRLAGHLQGARASARPARPSIATASTCRSPRARRSTRTARLGSRSPRRPAPNRSPVSHLKRVSANDRLLGDQVCGLVGAKGTPAIFVRSIRTRSKKGSTYCQQASGPQNRWISRRLPPSGRLLHPGGKV